LRETFNVPDEDRFITISEHDEDSFLFSRSYMGIERSDDLVILQITVSNTRTVEQKKALFARIAERLAQDPGLRREDVFINLVEVVKENWSFGNGIAQYAD
jgi:phenylpyruvate tautomerase PptA (4-oxalocrotonate tautomerase family)